MAVDKNLIQSIEELKKSINEISVYDINVYSAIELYYKLSQKMNEIIKETMRFEDAISQEVVTQNDKLVYLLGDGLTTEVTNRINKMNSNGTMAKLINETAFGEILAELNKKLDDDSIIHLINLGQDVKDAITGTTGLSSLSNGSVLKENIVSNQVDYTKTNFLTTGTNLLNLDTLTYNQYMDIQGKLHTGNYVVTDYIPVNGNTSITLCRKSGSNVSRRAIRVMTCFDSSFNVISESGYDNSSLTEESVNIPNGVYFIRLSIGSGLATTDSMICFGSTVLPIENFKYKIKYLETDSENPLKGKSILGFGDSIMYGAGNDGVGIVNLIAERNNMTYVNNAVSGATILKDSNNNIPVQIEEYSDTADYILLEGYINDCNISGIENRVGEVTGYYSSSLDTNTFCGQLEDMLKTVQNKFTGKKIAYVFVHKMSTRGTDIQKIIHDKSKEICDKWSIPIIDLFEESNLNTNITEYKQYTNNSDGTHPTQTGYELYYLPLIEAKLKTL
ncbi:MAG: SGNH/GDSL hydrolase family protein [Bacilli bacterium]